MVTQGSKLGPHLFTIYISPLQYIKEQSPNMKHHIFKHFTNNLYDDEIKIHD